MIDNCNVCVYNVQFWSIIKIKKRIKKQTTSVVSKTDGFEVMPRSNFE